MLTCLVDGKVKIEDNFDSLRWSVYWRTEEKMNSWEKDNDKIR